MKLPRKKPSRKTASRKLRRKKSRRISPYEAWLGGPGPRLDPPPDQLRSDGPAVTPEQLQRFTKEQRAYLAANVRLDCPDIRAMTEDQLPAYFRRKEGLNEMLLIRTFVFQYFMRFLDGHDDPIRGNIRSFWYRKLARQLERLGVYANRSCHGRISRADSRGRALLKRMENCFEGLFIRGFFRYRDLEVYNHRERFRRMGRTYRRHLLYTEKEGLFWFCEAMHARHSLHVYASRGSASWLDIDYLAQAIADLGFRNIYIAALTDFDPWGLFIAWQIKKKFESGVFGFRNIRLEVLTDLSLFDPATIQSEKRYLLQGHEDKDDPVRSIVENWIAKGGGIDGQPYGLHVDHANWSLVEARVQDWLAGKWRGIAIDFDLPEDVVRKAERIMRSAD